MYYNEEFDLIIGSNTFGLLMNFVNSIYYLLKVCTINLSKECRDIYKNCRTATFKFKERKM